MQYAKVYVDAKSNLLDNYLFYKIPAKLLPYIKTYSQVLVPYAKSEKKAIVTDIVKNVSPTIKSKLKNIKKIIYNFPVLDDRHFYIAQEISKKYICNMGQILNRMVYDTSKKEKDIQFSQKKYIKKNYPNHKYLLLDHEVNRYEHYIKILQKTLQNHKSAMLLVADFNGYIKLIETVKEKFKNSVIFDPKDLIGHKTINWLNLYQKKIVVIGTRANIFNIPSDLGAIIIHEPNHFGFKEEQTIHYQTTDIAKMICQITGANLFLGENIQYPQDIKQYKIIVNNFRYFQKSNIVIVNLDYELLSKRIKNIIKSNIIQNYKTFIIADKMEESSGIICSDCKHIFYCDRCECLERKISDSHKKCPKCKKTTNIPYGCPICSSLNLSSFGETAKNIFDKLSIKYPKKVQFITDAKMVCDKQITISNQYFSSYNTKKFDCTIILDWDAFSYQKSIDGNIKIAEKLLKISSFTDKTIYIQTKNTEENNLHLLCTKKLRQYYKNDLLLRKNYNLPPYKKIIKISLKDSRRDIVIKKIYELKNKMEKIIDKKYLSITEGLKHREKYKISLLIKIPHDNYKLVHKTLLDNYQALHLSNYQIDTNTSDLM